MMDHLVWELVAAHADTPTLLRVRRLCRDAAQLAERHAPLCRMLPAMRKGWQRRLALDAALRGPDNPTRWRSLAATQRSRIAAIIVHKHIRIGPAVAPTQARTLECLKAADATLKATDVSDGGPCKIPEGLAEVLYSLLGINTGYAVRVCLQHLRWQTSRVDAEKELDQILARNGIVVTPDRYEVWRHGCVATGQVLGGEA